MKKLATLLIPLLAASLSHAGVLTLGLTTATGVDTNPSGVSEAETQAMGWTQMYARWLQPGSNGALSVSYFGDAYGYVPNTAWAAHRHRGHVSLARTMPSGLSAGATFDATASRNRLAYSSYDYNEYSGSLWLRARSRAYPYRLTATLETRRYPESSEFDHNQLGVRGSVSHAWPTRTSAELGAHWRARSYRVPNTEDIATGGDAATSRQLQLNARVSQGLDSATGLKVTAWRAFGSGAVRWQDDYWLYMGDPLATSGFGGEAQISRLIPGGLTLRVHVSGSVTDEAYVDGYGFDSERRDKTGEVGAELEGYLPWTAAGRAFQWTLEVRSARQNSSDDYYTMRQTAITLGLQYEW